MLNSIFFATPSVYSEFLIEAHFTKVDILTSVTFEPETDDRLRVADLTVVIHVDRLLFCKLYFKVISWILV